MFSKAVKNNWWPVHGDDRRKRLILDMNRTCNRVKDEHTRVSDVHLATQEQKVLERLQYDIEVPCGSQWCLLWYAAPTKPSTMP